MSETAQPEKPAHGLVRVRDPDGALSPANSAHHSNLGASTDMTWVTLGKSRVREIRPPGSVRAKAEWLSYWTTTSDFETLRCEAARAADLYSCRGQPRWMARRIDYNMNRPHTSLDGLTPLNMQPDPSRITT